MSTLDQLNEAKAFIQKQTDFQPSIGVTLGSGLASFADELNIQHEINFGDIPHFAPSKVKGHPGKLLFAKLGEKNLAVLQGRIHYYEGHTPQQVVFPTRLLGSLGVGHQIITNAAGGIDPKMKPGHLMIIKDHINLTGTNPLIGENHEELGPRFPDMTNPFDLDCISTLEKIMADQNVSHSTGVYCGVSGPTYETAAEIKFMQTIGGQAVGMSTVPEVIAARHMGLKVTGISCITNLATGLSDEVLDHADVTAVAKRVEAQFKSVLVEFIKSL